MKIPTLVEKQKKYFGTYSVMALHNARTVFDHIQEIADIDDSTTGKAEDLWIHPIMSYLWNTYNGNGGMPEKALFIIERLQTYFPFLKIMAENQREYSNKKNNQNRIEVNSSDICNVLDRILRILKMYRDNTAHYQTYENKFVDNCDFLTKKEQPLAYMINNYYTVALRNIKERYGYKSKELTFIQDNRYKFVKDVSGRKKSQVNLNFFLSLLDYNDDKTKKLHLSGIGVALLICLFLDKQYINLFLTKLPIFSSYGPQSEERKIILRSMSINSIKLPKDRIYSEKSNKSIALDMLNEIKRCPKELFDVISPEMQSHFRLFSNDHNEVLMRRSTDRFVQLILQYIDYGKLFKGIRFHVNMGKLRFLFKANKNCIDNQNRVRVIEQPLNGFGRIEEAEDIRKQENGTFAKTGITIRNFENMRRDDADPANYPYIVDTYTHYILENNKVEMFFCDEPLIPEIEKGRYVVKRMPSCRMSALEIPAMAFHLLLFGSEKTEKLIKDICAKYRKLFEAMKNEDVTAENLKSFGIAEKDLPQKLLDLVYGNAHGKDVDKFIMSTIETMLASTGNQIKRLKEDKRATHSTDNKMGKRNFRHISTGKLAEFLAKDIVLFQPSVNDGENKITGLNYRIMQSGIALYNSMGDSEAKLQFKQMFEKARLIGNNRNVSHPFLYKVFARYIPANTIEFYEKYLIERKFYLKMLLDKIEQGNKVNIPFIRRDQNKWKKPVMSNLGFIYDEDLPIELPRQMFDSEIKDYLRSMPQMSDIDFSNANVTFLIAEYMKRIMKDDFQAFYSWDRKYHYIDMLKGDYDKRHTLQSSFTTVEERERLWKERVERTDSYRKQATINIMSNRLNRYMTPSEINNILDKSISRYRNEYQKCEKLIRRYKVQDALLFLMAKKALKETADFDGDRFKLKEIMPDAERGILSEIMPITFTFEKDGKTYTIKSNDMKLKNYGDFFVIANDNRIVKLMELVDSDIVSKENLMEEFKKYDQCRPEIASIVFDLEKWAFDKFPELSEKVRLKEKVDFKAIIQVLANNKKVENQQGYILRKIRNAFDHNNYPDKGIVKITTLPEIALNIKKLFGDYAIII